MAIEMRRSSCLKSLCFPAALLFAIMPAIGLAAAVKAKPEKSHWVAAGKAFDGVIDFDKLVSDPAQPGKMLVSYDSGDHLHPNDAGHKAMGEAVDLSLFSR